MIAFPDITNLDVFPYAEGYHFEFKKSSASITNEKLISTICAFLNTEGGYYIVGVEDGSRNILGVNENKDLDHFLLRVDDIHHLKHITYDDSTPISTETMKVLTFPVKNKKVLCVIQVIPEEGKKYILSSGQAYYRLSASNLKCSNVKNHIDNLIIERTKVIQGDYDKLMKHSILLDKEKNDFENKTKSLMNELAILEKKEKEATQILFTWILQQKKKKEDELYGKQKEISLKPQQDDLDTLSLCCLLA